MLRPAVQSTVQDLGRRGQRHLGVGTGGAMDRVALQIGNALVGNTEDAAALELCLPPSAIRFEGDHLIALTGADCAARLDGATLQVGCSVMAKAGMMLELSHPAHGARAYLCIAGGIDVPQVLASRSTDLQSQLGGLAGRMLRRGDALHVLPASSVSRPDRITMPAGDHRPIRVMPGPEFDEFEPRSRASLFETPWRISPQSNRMGFRLEGPGLLRRSERELKSHAVFPGLIQVPPGGAPIVLMADAHVTGGYPRIGTVIAADQGRLAQVPPGGTVQFARCARAEAVRAWQEQQAWLHDIRSGLHAH